MLCFYLAVDSLLGWRKGQHNRNRRRTRFLLRVLLGLTIKSLIRSWTIWFVYAEWMDEPMKRAWRNWRTAENRPTDFREGLCKVYVYLAARFLPIFIIWVIYWLFESILRECRKIFYQNWLKLTIVNIDYYLFFLRLYVRTRDNWWQNSWPLHGIELLVTNQLSIQFA